MWTNRLFVPAIAVALTLSSCSDDPQPDFYNGTGLLTVALTAPANTDPQLTVDDFTITLTPASTPENAYSWPSLSDMQQPTRYLAGSYTLSCRYGNPENEGFDMAAYGDSKELEINEGESKNVTLIPRLINVPVSISASEAFATRYPQWSANVHASGGSYIEIPAGESRAAYLRPAPMSVAVSFMADNGYFRMASAINLIEGAPTRLVLDLEGNTAVLKANGNEAGRLDVTPELLATTPPTVTLNGAPADGSALNLLERTAPENAVSFSLHTESPLAEVLLTLDSPLLAASGVAREINLLNPDDASRRLFADAGVALPDFSSPSPTFEISGLLALLQYSANLDPVSQFSLTVTDVNGRQSDPTTLVVNTQPVNLRVISATDAVIGINTVDVIVAAPPGNIAGEFTSWVRTSDGNISEAEVISVTPQDNGTFLVVVRIPEGTEPVTLLAYYGSELKGELQVNRVSPDFTIEADAFASHVKLRISCPGHADLLPVIVRELQLTIQGREPTIYSRDEQTGIISLIGLSPRRAYTVDATLQPGVEDATRSVKFHTEPAEALPNGGFEDVKKTIKWKDMASGGLYSQNFAEIFNCQNLTSFDFYTPEGWTSTNAKTFCESSKRPNTWYMQPSVVTIEDAAEGDYAVELVSTAFDPDGPEILNYLQESRPFTRYSRNIPDIAWRAAARIFLGGYNYSPFPIPSETITEGVGFESRPASLNGYYSYSPSANDTSDRGLVKVVVLGSIDGHPGVIASGSLLLEPTAGYATFSIPLTYNHFGIKATSIKVMCSSSSRIGDIAFETANVPVKPDPVTSTAKGSTLRLDNLTFAY